jgi:lysophospholipid acyltransferase (LPLAT)-like uncharacterized protein
MPEPAPKTSGVVVPNQPRWFQRVAGWLVYAAIQVVALTLRYKWTDRSGLADGQPAGPVIYATWHNRLILCFISYFHYVKKRFKSQGLAVMVSASKDGAFLAAILECFGVQPARGSSSRRGAQALRELTSWARRGYDLGITPDGPRGPRYEVQDGVVALAQLTGLPIVPLSYHLNWKICLKSWDRFQIPLPFSRCEMFFEKPIRVSREATPEERETARRQIENALKSISGE